MLNDGTQSEQALSDSIQDAINDRHGYNTRPISGNVFLVKDPASGEIFEIEVRGNIDPGAWEF